MKKLTILICAVVLSVMPLVANATPVLNYDYALGNGGFTSPYAGVQLATFDGSDAWNNGLGWAWDGAGGTITGSLSGYNAAPYGPSGADATDYLTVPYDMADGVSMSATGFGTANYLGLWWGSIDTYNTLNFYNGLTLVASVTGSMVSPTPNGNWTNAATNRYVNILGLPDFDTFELVSTNYAFEVDNIAVGTVAPVPEPGTMLLLGIGMFGLALYGKRRMNS